MSEVPDKDVTLHPAPMTASTGAGALLRAAREAQGLHITALAVTLKVPVNKLEALEADRFDLLPDIVFVRALALSVCRILKIDAAPVMLGLPQLQTPRIKTDESGLNTSFKPDRGGLISARMTQFLNPAGIVVLVLLVAIVVVFLWPAKPSEDDALVTGNRAGPEPVLASSQAEVPVESGPVKLSPLTITEPVRLAENATSHAGAVSAAAVSMAAPHDSATSFPAVAPLQPPVLGLQARGESWVEVIDANGAAQLRKVVADGERFQLSGVLPLSVVVGRADMVSVSIRGQPFDLAAVSKDNVARFEVK
jgi:cytoskeleton protein RodZ